MWKHRKWKHCIIGRTEQEVEDLESSVRDDAEACNVVWAEDEKEVDADGGDREGSVVTGSSGLGDVDRELVDFNAQRSPDEEVPESGGTSGAPQAILTAVVEFSDGSCCRAAGGWGEW
ncbi:hypothetical protein HDV00_002002 [Rhizophlyctis rosea]|nr:hypothetical protein HDV00_002002 [Rhizophlyctis rosea]